MGCTGALHRQAGPSATCCLWLQPLARLDLSTITQDLHNSLPALGSNRGIKHNTGLIASGYFQMCLAQNKPSGHCVGRVVGESTSVVVSSILGKLTEG